LAGYSKNLSTEVDISSFDIVTLLSFLCLVQSIPSEIQRKETKEKSSAWSGPLAGRANAHEQSLYLVITFFIQLMNWRCCNVRFEITEALLKNIKSWDIMLMT